VWPPEGQERDCRMPAKEELFPLWKVLLAGMMGLGGRLNCRRLLRTLQGYCLLLLFRNACADWRWFSIKLVCGSCSFSPRCSQIADGQRYRIWQVLAEHLLWVLSVYVRLNQLSLLSFCVVIFSGFGWFLGILLRSFGLRSELWGRLFCSSFTIT